jgi:hypothetical protein
MATPSDSSTDQLEIRATLAKSIVDTLDAYSIARGLTRNQLMAEVLGEWVRMRHRELSVAARVLRLKPESADAAGAAR